MIGLKNSYEIAYNGTENECRFELYADTAADLQGLTHIDGIKIQMGSECAVIATGDKYILNGSGVWVLQPSANAWENVYTTPEIDTMITTIYQYMMYYHTTQTSTDGTITFYAFSGFVGTLTIYGNGQQTGTPTPDNPIQPDFVGKKVGDDWTIPISCAGQTTPVNLGEVPTVRRVKKLVLDGTEKWRLNGRIISVGGKYYNLSIATQERTEFGKMLCSHYIVANPYDRLTACCVLANYSMGIDVRVNNPNTEESIDDFKAYLAAQYSAGHPVTIWYVLAEPTTGIVNEPLAKIGTYADELHSTDAAVTIPTVKGSNTLTVDTLLKPSKIEISGER